MAKDFADLVRILHREVVPATGCTEPIAVAYQAAAAREEVEGKLVSISVTVDPGLYKNGMRVAIPGIAERGLDVAAALGFVAGDKRRGLQVIEGVNEEQVAKARSILAEGSVEVKMRPGCPVLFIETVLSTDREKVRLVTVGKHLNIVKIDKGDRFEPFVIDQNSPLSGGDIDRFELTDFLEFANNVPLEQISFLLDGIDMNLKVAEVGLAHPDFLAYKLTRLVSQGLIADDAAASAEILGAAAAQARMAGCPFPVMSSAGSGNQGITVFTTLYALGQRLGVDSEHLARALALSHLVTTYIKAHIGALSAMCGCGVAAGIGAAAGCVYLMGKGHEDIIRAIRIMIGSITGMLCDGAKEGCAYKIALACGWAVETAYLAVSGADIDRRDGIVGSDFRSLILNLGHICNPGMEGTNEAVLNIMLAKKEKQF